MPRYLQNLAKPGETIKAPDLYTVTAAGRVVGFNLSRGTARRLAAQDPGRSIERQAGEIIGQF